MTKNTNNLQPKILDQKYPDVFQKFAAAILNQIRIPIKSARMRVFQLKTDNKCI